MPSNNSPFIKHTYLLPFRPVVPLALACPDIVLPAVEEQTQLEFRAQVLAWLLVVVLPLLYVSCSAAAYYARGVANTFPQALYIYSSGQGLKDISLTYILRTGIKRYPIDVYLACKPPYLPSRYRGYIRKPLAPGHMVASVSCRSHGTYIYRQTYNGSEKMATVKRLAGLFMRTCIPPWLK